MSTTDINPLVCPLMGKVCPGVDNCAPAVLAAPDGHSMHRACPIIAAVGAISTTAAALYQFMLEDVEEDDGEDTQEETAKTLTEQAPSNPVDKYLAQHGDQYG